MYCTWITFDSSDLTEIIIKLAKKYNNPVFQPHCTLIGKTDISLPRMKSAIINLIDNYKMIELHPNKIAYSDYLWQALYIELKELQTLTKWHEHICNLLSINPDKDYIPHISLMYNKLSLKEKKIISSKIKLKSVYKIHSIQIVECGKNIDGWNVAFEFKI
jgi:2'-5' RNA ligase